MGYYAAANPFRFSTKYTDIETTLVYYGTRYYSPSLGRFLNRDTIGEQGGVNLYAFVNNNPVNRWDYLGMVDPKGLQACDGVWKPRNLTEAWDNQIDQFAFVKEADWNMTGTGFARNQYRVTMSDGTSMVVHANSATEASDIARDRAGSTPATGFLQAYSNIINAGGVSTGLPGASSTAPNNAGPTAGQRWLQGGQAAVGLVANAAGVVTAFGLALLPEPTMLSKAGAVALGLKTSYGVGANFQNLLAAINGTEAPSTGALINDVTALALPGNQNAQTWASIADLTTDLSAGPLVRNAIARRLGPYETFPVERLFIQNPMDLGVTVDVFQGLDASSKLLPYAGPLLLTPPPSPPPPPANGDPRRN